MITRAKDLTKIILLTAWLIISITFFSAANRVSYIHTYSPPSWHFFIYKLSQLHILIYVYELFVAFIGILFFSLACTGLGLVVLDKLKIPTMPKLGQIITAFVIGEVTLSTIFLSLISTSALTPTITATIIATCLIVSFSLLIDFIQHLKLSKQLKVLYKQQKDLMVLTIGIVILYLMLSAARLGYDSVSDYFSQAKFMAVSQGAYSFFPENYMIVSSLHPDILFTAIIQLFGDQSARMLSWVNGVAILLIGYAIAEEVGISQQSMLYFTILLATSTAFTDLLGDGKVELISTIPILTAIYWMLISSKLPNRGIFLLIGFLLGFAIISRLYNIFLVSVFAIIFYTFGLYKLYRAESKTNPLHLRKLILHYTLPILWILPALIIIGGVHLWQNWQWLGSPIAPLEFAQKLKSSNWEWQFDPKMLNILRVLYPLTVTFFNSPQSLGNISPLFIGFLPFLSIKDIRENIFLSSSLNYLLFTTISTLLLWVVFFYTIVEIRYVLFLWTILFLPMAQLIEYSLARLPTSINFLNRFLIKLLLLYLAARTISIALMTYSPVGKNGEAHCFDINLCIFFDSVNQTAAPGDRVFVLNAYRYYLRPDLFSCSSRSNEYSTIQKFARNNSPEFWIEVYRQGYRFLTYEENFAMNHSRFGKIPDPKEAPPWLKISIISPLNKSENISYKIEASNPPFQPEILCRQKSKNVWQLIYILK